MNVSIYNFSGHNSNERMYTSDAIKSNHKAVINLISHLHKKFKQIDLTIANKIVF